jgi:high-affinity nickel permease
MIIHDTLLFAYSLAWREKSLPEFFANTGIAGVLAISVIFLVLLAIAILGIFLIRRAFYRTPKREKGN